MASKILIIYLRIFIFIGMVSSITSKNLNYQQTLNMPGYASSEHQVLFQKVGFYAATVQYLHVVIPVPLTGIIESLVKMSDELGQYQQDQNKAGNPMAAINGAIIRKARSRIANLVNKIYAIIDSLPEDERITKRQLVEILSGVGTLMGLFNSFEISRIAKGVGENRKKINSIIDITKLNAEHLENLRVSTNKISNIITAMLQNNPAQLISEIDDILDKGNDAVTRITNMVQQAQNKRLSVDLLTPDTLSNSMNTWRTKQTNKDLNFSSANLQTCSKSTPHICTATKRSHSSFMSQWFRKTTNSICYNSSRFRFRNHLELTPLPNLQLDRHRSRTSRTPETR